MFIYIPNICQVNRIREVFNEICNSFFLVWEKSIFCLSSLKNQVEVTGYYDRLTIVPFRKLADFVQNFFKEFKLIEVIKGRGVNVSYYIGGLGIGGALHRENMGPSLNFRGFYDV